MLIANEGITTVLVMDIGRDKHQVCNSNLIPLPGPAEGITAMHILNCVVWAQVVHPKKLRGSP
jgi:hypothetical protein